MSDYESDMASLCDLINTHCLECGVVEASDYTLVLMRAAVDRIVFKQRTELIRLRAALAQSCEEARSVALAEPGRTRTCPLERELRQEIERLRAEIDECRRLLTAATAQGDTP